MTISTHPSGVQAGLIDDGSIAEMPAALAVYSTGATIRVRPIGTKRTPLYASGSAEYVDLVISSAQSVAFANRSAYPSNNPTGLPSNCDGLVVEVLAGTIYFNGAGTLDGSDGAGSGIRSDCPAPSAASMSITVGQVLYWGRA